MSERAELVSGASVVEAPTAALSAAIRQREAPARMQHDLAGWLREQGVEGDDLRAMLAVGPERMLVYRKLVHNRLRGTILDFIERTAARLGTGRFRRDFEAFVEERAPSSPYLRDVPAEFVEWAAPRWAADPEVPAWVPDLARHELLDYEVRNDPRGGEPGTGLPLALDRPLRFDGTVRLVRYGWAVHRLPRKKDDTSEPEAEPTRLLVYRDAEHKARYLALTPFADALLHELLLARKAVQPALVDAAAALGEPLDDEKLGAAAQLFADLAERNVCLGAEPA
jgi:hypothetical protein